MTTVQTKHYYSSNTVEWAQFMEGGTQLLSQEQLLFTTPTKPPKLHFPHAIHFISRTTTPIICNRMLTSPKPHPALLNFVCS